MSATHNRNGGFSRRLAVGLLGLLALAVPLLATAQKPAAQPEPIGIIGTGKVGSALARQWVQAHHPVLLSSRHPDQLQALAKELGPLARVGTPQQAARFGQVVLIAVPYGALPQVGQENRQALKGKVVIDASNPFPARDGEVARKALAVGIGAASKKYLQGARMVRAFNTIPATQVAAIAHRADPVATPLTGDDQGALKTAARLIEEAGFTAVLVGGLEKSDKFAPGSAAFGKVLNEEQLKKALGIE